MTDTELTVAAALFGVLDRHTDTNDVFLPNTEAVWELVERMNARNLKLTVDEYRALPDSHREKRSRPAGDTITYHSCHILPYLYERMKAESGAKE